VQEHTSTAVESPAGKTAKRRKVKRQQQPKRQPRYHVVLWDDNHHSYDYVVVMLHDLFGHPPAKGYRIAREVDTSGKAIVLTTTLEHAELKRDQIHSFGRDRAIKACAGSMTATLEAEVG
jgi:ATP-dependent Clp protease adaptor protein ClpS